MTTITVPVRAAPVAEINAGSLIEIPFACVDRQLAPVTPTGIRYRVDNITDGVILQGWTSETPAQNGTITIPASVNAMTRSWRQKQMNQVVIEYTTAAGVYQEKKLYELYAVNVGMTT